MPMKRKGLVEDADAVEEYTVTGKKTRRGIVAGRRRVKPHVPSVSRPSSTPSSRQRTQEPMHSTSDLPDATSDEPSFPYTKRNFKVSTSDSSFSHRATLMVASRIRQPQGDYIREFLNVRDEYLRHLLEREFCPPEATCGHTVQWRCLTCHAHPTYCTPCLRERHMDHPLHRVESWNHTHFTPDWLRHVGVEIHLGHGGKRCPRTTSVEGIYPPSPPGMGVVTPSTVRSQS